MYIHQIKSLGIVWFLLSAYTSGCRAKMWQKYHLRHRGWLERRQLWRSANQKGSLTGIWGLQAAPWLWCLWGVHVFWSLRPLLKHLEMGSCLLEVFAGCQETFLIFSINFCWLNLILPSHLQSFSSVFWCQWKCMCTLVFDRKLFTGLFYNSINVLQNTSLHQ